MIITDPNAPVSVDPWEANQAGSIADVILNHGGDPNVLRPYYDTKDGGKSWRAFRPKRTGRRRDDGSMIYNEVPTSNATTTLRKDDWKLSSKLPRNFLRHGPIWSVLD